MSREPTPRFVRVIAANIAYWQQHTADLTDDQIQVLNLDHANIFQAVAMGLEVPATQLDAAQLALQVYHLVERCSHWLVWPPLLEKALRLLPETEWSLRWQLLNRLGQLQRLNRELEAAVRAHQEAKAIARQWNDPLALAEIHYSLSVDYRHTRHYEQAEAYGLRALAEWSAQAVNGRVTAALNTLGLIAQERGELATAETRLRQAVELGRQVDPPTFLARSLNSLAVTLQRQGRYEAALRCFEEATALLGPTASGLDKVHVQLSQGALHFEQGQWPEAEVLFRRAAGWLRQQKSHTYHKALAYQSLGNTLLKQQRLAEAELLLHQAADHWRAYEDELMLANTLGTLGELLAVKGDLAAAVQQYDEALVLLKRFPDSAWAQKLSREFTAERASLGH